MHGLGGHPYTTWGSPSHDEAFWPLWLVEDIKSISTWTVSYEAAPSSWLGHSISIEDRAINILECLLTEPELKKGRIVFICHSLGGLLVKQLLRHANDLKQSRNDITNFMKQIMGVVFIATPHAGSLHANLMDKLRLFMRPSISTKNLIKNNSNLRALNTWYRNWRSDISHLVFMETKSTSGGIIVDSGSSDPGLDKVVPIPIDEDHIQITKPATRDSLLYKRIKLFILEFVPKNKLSISKHEVIKSPLHSIKIEKSYRVRKLFFLLMILLIVAIFFFYFKSWSTPKVTVRIKDNLPWLSECSEFTFSNLPKNFAIQHIKMNVLNIVGPTKIVANQSAKVDEFCTHKNFNKSELFFLKSFDIDVKRYSTENQDKWITLFCPSIVEKGYEAKITVMPTYYGLDGKEILDDFTQPFELYISHPKSVISFKCNG